MTDGPRLTPRKAPRQGRAKTTVDAILTAVARVLLADGYDATTTNRVAEVAGVSVGSLYQYFPSKESLVSALWQQRRAEKVNAVADALVEEARSPAADVARAVAEALVAAHADQPELERLLAVVGPRIGAERKNAPVDAQMIAAFTSFLERRRAGAGVPMRAELAVRALEGALAAVVRDHPEWLTTDALAVELAPLVRGWLEP